MSIYIECNETQHLLCVRSYSALRVCVAIFHIESFLKISTLSNCVCLSTKQAGIRWFNISTVYNYCPGSSNIQQIITIDDSRMNHCI